MRKKNSQCPSKGPIRPNMPLQEVPLMAHQRHIAPEARVPSWQQAHQGIGNHTWHLNWLECRREKTTWREIQILNHSQLRTDSKATTRHIIWSNTIIAMPVESKTREMDRMPRMPRIERKSIANVKNKSWTELSCFKKEPAWTMTGHRVQHPNNRAIWGLTIHSKKTCMLEYFPWSRGSRIWLHSMTLNCVDSCKP